MDRRCLYGHRVNATFHYAIERDQCPICGAELISLDGYRLARQLAQSVPLDGSAAFRTVKLIEAHYVLKARPAGTAEAGRPAHGVVTPEVPPGTELTLEEEDLAPSPATPSPATPSPATPAAAPAPATPSRPLAEEREDDVSVELVAAEVTDEQERAARRAPTPPRASAARARTPPAPPAVPTATPAQGPGAATASATGAPFSVEEDAFFASSP